MAGISKCAGNDLCEIKNECYRHWAEDSEYHQSYMQFCKGVVRDKKDCLNFYDRRKEI